MELSKSLTTVASVILISAVAFAATREDKAQLGREVVTQCRDELVKSPHVIDLNDSEEVWQNMRAKIKQGNTFDSNCIEAYEEYQAKFHPYEAQQEIKGR